VCPLPLVVFKDEDEVRRCMNYSRWIFQRRQRSWDSLGLRLDSVALSPIFRSTTNSKVFLVLWRALYQWYKFIAIIVTTPSTLNIIVSLLRQNYTCSNVTTCITECVSQCWSNPNPSGGLVSAGPGL
jgi:hypothetical protein